MNITLADGEILFSQVEFADEKGIDPSYIMWIIMTAGGEVLLTRGRYTTKEVDVDELGAVWFIHNHLT